MLALPLPERFSGLLSGPELADRVRAGVRASSDRAMLQVLFRSTFKLLLCTHGVAGDDFIMSSTEDDPLVAELDTDGIRVERGVLVQGHLELGVLPDDNVTQYFSGLAKADIAFDTNDTGHALLFGRRCGG